MTSHEEYNARRFVWANGLQGIGDQIVAAKTVLPWLFTAAGVPALFTAFLVPIRESGSMLPQAALSPWVTSQRSRKWVWLVGSWGQATSAALIALAAALLNGAALGVAVVILLAALSIFRALCSIAGKDVQGRTVSKSRSVASSQAKRPRCLAPSPSRSVSCSQFSRMTYPDGSW